MKTPAFNIYRVTGLLAAPVYLFFCFSSFASSPASPGDEETPESQWSGEIELPMWGVGESREGFDVRIWPDEVLVWLEQENLRDLIADPEVPEEEKNSLREILAQQLAWNNT